MRSFFECNFKSCPPYNRYRYIGKQSTSKSEWPIYNNSTVSIYYTNYPPPTLQTIFAAHETAVFQQMQSTCYAHAIAQAIIAAELRIIGRPIEHHWSLVDNLVNKYGGNGGSIRKILPRQCLKRHLRCAQINEYQAEQTIMQNRVVIVAFSLSQRGWGQFLAQKMRSPEAIVQDLQQGDYCHAAVIIGIDIKTDGKYWRIKNSQGNKFGINGIFRAKMHTVQFYFLDVFYDVNDLPVHEKIYFEDWLRMTPEEQKYRERFRKQIRTFALYQLNL